MKKLKIFSIQLAYLIALGLVFISCNVVSGRSALVGRWSLIEGPTRGNPEELELLRDGSGVGDGVGGMIWKVENGRLYLTPPGFYRYNEAAWRYKVSGSTLTLTADNGVILKYQKR